MGEISYKLELRGGAIYIKLYNNGELIGELDYLPFIRISPQKLGEDILGLGLKKGMLIGEVVNLAEDVVERIKRGGTSIESTYLLTARRPLR